MFRSRIARLFRRRIRAIAVWVAVPLVVLNGRTVVGCGCSGHFETMCHCGCCSHVNERSRPLTSGQSSCCSGKRVTSTKCASCDATAPARHTDKAATAPPSSSHHGLQPHHCKSIVLHELIPVTVAPSIDVGGVHSTITALADFTSMVVVPSSARLTVDFDIGPPPNDLVVSLHRLVI